VFRDLEMEQEVLRLTHKVGIGAQFGGKYFWYKVFKFYILFKIKRLVMMLELLECLDMVHHVLLELVFHVQR
jgi:hypothetical protein